MLTERTIQSPAAAVKHVATPPGESVTPTAAAQTATPAAPVKVWKFVKNFTPADKFFFKDGSEFSFPLIVRNDGAGYSSNSVFTTTDEALAINLQGLTKNRATGVIEITK